MIKLVIKKIDGNNYFLNDEDDNEYRFHIQFYDLDKEVQIGDRLFVNKRLLESPTYLFSFGPLVSDYGRKVLSIEDPDLVALVIGDEKIYLKRYYG